MLEIQLLPLEQKGGGGGLVLLDILGGEQFPE